MVDLNGPVISCTFPSGIPVWHIRRIASPRRPAVQRDIHIHHHWLRSWGIRCPTCNRGPCVEAPWGISGTWWGISGMLRSSYILDCPKMWIPEKKVLVDSVDSFYWKNIHKNRQLCWWFAYGQPQISFYIQCSTNPSMFNKPQQKLLPLSQCWQVLIQRTLAWQNWQSQLR